MAIFQFAKVVTVAPVRSGRWMAGTVPSSTTMISIKTSPLESNKAWTLDGQPEKSLPGNEKHRKNPRKTIGKWENHRKNHRKMEVLMGKS